MSTKETMTVGSISEKLRLHAEFQASLGGAGELLGPLDILLIADAIDAHFASIPEIPDSSASQPAEQPRVNLTDVELEYVEVVTQCCGRYECGGECGNEWRGMVARPKLRQPVGDMVSGNLRNRIHQMAFEMGDADDGGYVLTADQLDALIDIAFIPRHTTAQPKPEQAPPRCDSPGCNCASWMPEGCAWDGVEPEQTLAKPVYAVAADGRSESGHQLYTLHDEPVPMADNWRLVDPASKHEQAVGDGWREACEYMLAGRPDELASIRAHASSLASLASPSAGAVVPEGHKVTPREPTPKMFKACDTVIQGYGAKLVWQRMYDAAPEVSDEKD